MRVLHTSDWHVGRTARGHSRAGEHRDVLAEITALTRRLGVDLVVVAGDQFDRSAPSAADERLVWRTLADLAAVAPVVVVAGNHDHPSRLDAVAHLLARSGHGVHALGRLPGDDLGPGRLRLALPAGDVHVALLPWVSQRGAVTAEVLMDAATSSGDYGARYAHTVTGLVGQLCEEMDDTSVNLLVGHTTVLGGATGGGERDAHTTITYHVPATAFPAVLDYAALGHFHRRQHVQRTGPPVAYSGSPLALDFGEAGPRGVLVVDVEAGRTATVTEHDLRGGRPMVTVDATAATLDERLADVPGDAWVRVRLTGPVAAGIGDRARDLLGERLLAVQVQRETTHRHDPDAPSRLARPATEVFAEYAAQQGLDDDAVVAAFGAHVADLEAAAGADA